MAKKQKLKAPKVCAGSRAVVHDLIPLDVPKHVEGAVVEIDNALYDKIDEARQDERGEWRTGDRERVRVVISFKHDPVGRMFARGQIQEAEYKAARELQRLHDQAQIGVIRAMDPSKECVDGGLLPDPLTDVQQRAIRQIRAVERGLKMAHGTIGLSLINAVLVGKQTLEQAARDRGADTTRRIEFWCGLFHQCLHSLGIEMGTIKGAAA